MPDALLRAQHCNISLAIYVDDKSSHWHLDIPSTMAKILKAQSRDVEVSELKGRIGITDDVNRVSWEVQQGVLYGVSPCDAGLAAG